MALTSPDGAVSMSSVSGLVGIGFTISVPAPTQNGILKVQRVGVRPLHPFLSLTGLLPTTNILS